MGGVNHDGNFILTGFNGPGWVFHPSGNQSLYLIPGWDFSKGARFEPSGNVTFFQRVSIGDVSGPGTLGTNNRTLAVGGKIGARAIHVVAPNVAWPDYVFADSYALRPLLEVERFVRANGHLPAVPAAAVRAEGLGRMDAVLLGKVEELTLYLIALKKENDALKEWVRKLEN